MLKILYLFIQNIQIWKSYTSNKLRWRAMAHHRGRVFNPEFR